MLYKNKEQDLPSSRHYNQLYEKQVWIKRLPGLLIAASMQLPYNEVELPPVGGEPLHTNGIPHRTTLLCSLSSGNIISIVITHSLIHNNTPTHSVLMLWAFGYIFAHSPFTSKGLNESYDFPPSPKKECSKGVNEKMFNTVSNKGYTVLTIRGGIISYSGCYRVPIA